MKRKAEAGSPEAVEADASRKRPPRQDPVSCQTCRAKKLKCDRNQPCANCTARKITCIYGTGRIGNVSDRNTQYTQEKPDATIVPHQEHGARRQPLSSNEARPSRESSEQCMTADWLENIVMGPRIPDALPTTLKDKLIPFQQNGNEEAVQRAMAIPLGATGGRQFNVRNSYLRGQERNLGSISLASLLPTKSETLSLFRYYVDCIDYLYHVIVPVRVERMIDDIYRCIENNSPVNLNHVALLASILAVTVYFRPQSATEYTESSDADARCKEFTSLVGAALLQSNFIAYPTIEGLQATIIIAHYLSSLNTDPSLRSLFLHGTIVSQAKNLMLHYTDTPQHQEERRVNGFDSVEVETRRRLWWHLVAYDWLLGFLSGPQERTYLIHPNHMNVRRPLNIDDGPSQSYGSERGLKRSIPTSMSYSIERLKLAFVCREIVDETAVEHFQGLEVNYERILDLDRRIQQVYKELPEFFRLDPVSRRRYAQLYRERPTIAWQRCLVQQGYHSRLCRLHRQYFIRGAGDPAFSYSHVICLQSARKVLEIKRIMDEEEPIFTPNSSVVWSVMHHVFMAAVILLMDVCFNWDDILANKRREEVLDACRMLSKAQQASTLVREGINAMMSILQKYWRPARSNPGPVDPTTCTATTAFTSNSMVVESPASNALPTPQSNFPTSEVDGKFLANPSPVNDAFSIDNGSRELEDIWTAMLDNGGNLATEQTDWMDLLTELTNATIPCE
ncbi:transcriptional regulator family: Fungal Specific TF [Paecilomyces variotii]|nr:transcriptional regulator family: Fungal Specific TF [Paecilomyces variotii]KAJ9229597.1 transcriptional regulator family: Fungal Specific TF [Paecilomyces variotii]KAJ9289027.1 transcriptional regulator family: Fungal Specific TF [Paecilomyces variotii]KAJ9294009.1 transcriptional regulator family: Fungal Specific TF [Paecilomyces variotii]KAJ9319986.1 transcriptional regulator family: Fungal Specific TF [Paecilomyces variotii]